MARHTGAKRVDQVMDDAIVLVTVDPAEDGAAWREVAHQRVEPALRVGQMVEHSDRIDKVEGTGVGRTAKGRRIDVGLDDVGGLKVADVVVGGFDGDAEVHGDDVLRAELAREIGMPADAAAGVEHHLIAEELRLERMNPVEELLAVLGVELDKMLPLVPEGLSGPLLLPREIRRQQARNAALNRKVVAALPAVQTTFHDLLTTAGGALQLERSLAQRTGEVLEQAGGH